MLTNLIPVEDKHHAIAAEAELWDSVPTLDYPPEPSPDVLHAKGFRDGFAGHEQDKRFTWSLDYCAGHVNGICENFLANPNSTGLPCLTHQEGQPSEGFIEF